jgi:hypothetical protein
MIRKKLTNTFLIFAFLLTSYVANSQQVYIETGFENAYFKDYENNLGENTLDLNYSKPQEAFLEAGFRFKLYKDRVKWNLGLSYNKYKIKTGFYAGNRNIESIPVTYDLSYLTLKIGANVAIVNEPKFKLQIHSHISYDFLLAGTNSYLDVVNNLYEDNSLDRTFLRYHRGLSTEYIITDKISIYLSYNVADSFRDKNEDSNIEEKYSFHTHAFSLGLLFNIQKNK